MKNKILPKQTVRLNLCPHISPTSKKNKSMKLAIDQTTAVVSFMNQPVQLPGGSYCFSKGASLRVFTLLVCLLYGLGALSQTT